MARLDSSLAAMLPILRCQACGASRWQIVDGDGGVRVRCEPCGHHHTVHDDVLHVRSPREHDDVRQEREAVREIELRPELGGWEEDNKDHARIAPDLKAAYLSLPYGDGSFRFDEPGYFKNVRHFAPEFTYITGLLPVARGRLLDVGADGTWSTARLAAMGFDCIALDITDHLALGGLYQSDTTRYARVLADMHEPIFADASFDVITAFNVLHHSRRLPALAAGIARMLRPGGVLAFVEPYVQTEPQLQAFGAAQLDAGISESVHPLTEWHRTFEAAGLRLRTFSLSDSFNAIYWKPDAAQAATGLPMVFDGFIDRFYAARLSAALDAPARAGEPVAIRVTVTNTGPAGWASRGPWPIRLSYHRRAVLGDGSTEMLAFDNERTLLTEFLPAGESRDYLVPVTFERPGRYELEFDLVHEARCWFGERGAATAVLRCDVA